MNNGEEKILVVEDETSLRNVLRDKLIKENFRVYEAKNGEEGLSLAIREDPQLILVDIMMPKMNGLLMLEKIHQSGYCKDTHFIILTNLNNTEEVAEAMKIANEMGSKSFEYFIKSNIKLEDIVQKIREKLKV